MSSTEYLFGMCLQFMRNQIFKLYKSSSFSIIRIYSSLIEEEVPILTATWFTMAGWYPWNAHLYLRRNSGGMDAAGGQREEVGGLRRGEGGGTLVGI